MKIESNKIIISPEKLAINSDLYFFLKVLNGTEAKFKNADSDKFLELYYTHCASSFQTLYEIITRSFFDKIKGKRQAILSNLWARITCQEQLELFVFALNLLEIKPLLLSEARVRDMLALPKFTLVHPLSLAHDTLSKQKPYARRVTSALLALAFFEKLEDAELSFMSQDAEKFLLSLVKSYHAMKALGVETNQMFMLMFTESVNQGIISDAGLSYEDRVNDVLIKLGIHAIKAHDGGDKSTEYDFFFTLNNRSYGIGAKRTLRERYKQFIKTAQTTHIDVMIQITTGEDLPPEKAKTIRQHGVYLFIADEVYQREKALQKIEGIYPATQLTLETLEALT